MQINYRELPTNRSFGVELEVSKTLSKAGIADSLRVFEDIINATYKPVVYTLGVKGWAESRSNDYWHVKYDSTCGPLGKHKDHGWEIASYVAQGHQELDSISRAVNWLSHAGLETSRNCGFHVHVNAKNLSPRQMGILLARWIKVEPFLIGICDRSRKDNQYCRSLLMRYWDTGYLYDSESPEEFYLRMRPRNFSSHNNPDKKYTLNILGYTIYRENGYWDRPTVELRLPECRLDDIHVKNWTRLFLNFVESCQFDTSPPKNLYPVSTIQGVLKCLGLHGKSSFLILDDQLLDTKKWLLQKISKSYKLTDNMSDQAAKWLEFISQI